MTHVSRETCEGGRLRVLALGTRPAVRLAAGLLAEQGAEVEALQPSGAKVLDRHLNRVGPPEEERFYQVVLYSSDRGDVPEPAWLCPGALLCDIVVDDTGAHGAWEEADLQAAFGIAAVTGTETSPPVVSPVPLVEGQGAILAASAVLAALYQGFTKEPRRLRIRLADVAINNLPTFIPQALMGKPSQRIGNCHPMAAPWNSYPTQDGWILLCSATDAHWVTFCNLIGQPELAEGRYAMLADRIALRSEVDGIVAGWTSARPKSVVLEALDEARMATGEITPLDALKQDANLLLRNRVATDDAGNCLPSGFLDRNATLASLPRTAPASAGAPLSGLRVLEIGQYTTAPVAAKHLGLLGAEVIKLEPLSGEASRAWPPHQDGLGYFFVLNNAGKRSVALDLKDPDGKAMFERLIASADVLVENMKPFSLDRLGFAPEGLQEINSRLIHCAISGFGRKSVYPGRPAFDTVVQAMSGLMDLTRVDGVPTKMGVSAADVSGGFAGLLAILDALLLSKRTGLGAYVDLAMHDVSVWLTQLHWGGEATTGHLSEAPVGIETLLKDPGVLGDGTLVWTEDAAGRRWPLFRPLIDMGDGAPPGPGGIPETLGGSNGDFAATATGVGLRGR